MNLKTDIGIYSITHTSSGKKYIGSTYCNFYDRWCAHRSTLNRQCHSSILLQRAWNKYGSDAFTFDVIELGSVNLDVRELHFIKLHNSSNPKTGYNISKETNNHRLGHQQTGKSKKKISDKLKGTKRSKETIAKMSIAKSGSNSPSYDKKQSPELIAKRIRNNYTPVVRNDGEVYPSMKEAAAALNCPYQGIYQSIKKGHKVKGYRFSYVKTR